MKLSRSKAIRYLWFQAKEKGFDSDYVHELLKGLVMVGEIRYDRLTMLSSLEIARVLKHVFGMKVYVMDEPIVRYIKGMCRQDKHKMDLLKGILKRYKLESLYQLSDKQKRFVCGFLKNCSVECRDTGASGVGTNFVRPV